MTTPHEVETRFTVDLGALRRGVESAKAEVTDYRRKVQEQSARASKDMARFKESIDASKAAFAALGAAAVIQTARAVTELSKLSDQAQRIDQYFSSSFGVYTDTMRDWASGLSDAYGLAESQVESFAARLNSAFIGAGQSARDAAEMSQTLTQLSYDLSVKLPYATLEELQEMINDLAVGGGESALEKILPGLDEEALKAKAAELGILGDELTVVAKQTAAYHLLMEQYSDDIGLYSETGDTATRALAELDAAVHDLSESLGTLLAPVVQTVADILSDLVDVIDSVTGGIGEFLGLKKVAEAADYDLGVITQAMEQFRQEAEETDRTLMGLAGFDKLNLLNTSPGGVAENTDRTDWEHVFVNFAQMYENGSEEATAAMGDMWEHLLDQSDRSSEEMREALRGYLEYIETVAPGVTADAMEEMWDHMVEQSAKSGREMEDTLTDYFDWLKEVAPEVSDDAMEEMWANLVEMSERSGREMRETLQEYFDWIEETAPEVSAEAFYEGIEDMIRAQASAESLAAFVNEFVQEAIAQGWVAGLESYRPPEDDGGSRMDSTDVIWSMIPFMSNPDDIIEGLENMGDIGRELDKFADWVGGGIAEAGEEIGKAAEKVEEELGKFGDAVGREVDKFADWAGGILGFADGGVFLPNHPVLGILGDNTREVEVAAPKSVIVDAVREANNLPIGVETLRALDNVTPHGDVTRTADATIIAEAVARALADVLRSHGPSTGQTINLSLQLDGRTLSREVYRMMQKEELRRF